MKVEVFENFSLKFGVKLTFGGEMLVQRDGRFFLLNSNVNFLVRDDFFYAGIYLGKVIDGKVFPSFNLLDMLVKCEANRVVIGRKASWLFICGRDVFRKSILRIYGDVCRSEYVLVLNEFGECLGFGKVLVGLSEYSDKNVVAVANVLDVGDFLRRERVV
ncbi:MAG: hypothetical protein FWH37_07855 [Candidatus Bathyarchaeota archaeon]|nr:hypothetical protein [Candidatus Termiticorpusculum sp.]